MPKSEDYKQWYETLQDRVKTACADLYDSIDVDLSMADGGFVAERIAEELRWRREQSARDHALVMAIHDQIEEWRRAAERASIRSRDGADRLLAAVEHMQAGVLCGCAGDIEALFSRSVESATPTNAVDPVAGSHPTSPRA